MYNYVRRYLKIAVMYITLLESVLADMDFTVGLLRIGIVLVRTWYCSSGQHKLVSMLVYHESSDAIGKIGYLLFFASKEQRNFVRW